MFIDTLKKPIRADKLRSLLAGLQLDATVTCNSVGNLAIFVGERYIGYIDFAFEKIVYTEDFEREEQE